MLDLEYPHINKGFLWCCAQSSANQSQPKFPVNREINRENMCFSHGLKNVARNVDVITVSYRRFP